MIMRGLRGLGLLACAVAAIGCQRWLSDGCTPLGPNLCPVGVYELVLPANPRDLIGMSYSLPGARLGLINRLTLREDGIFEGEYRLLTLPGGGPVHFGELGFFRVEGTWTVSGSGLTLAVLDVIDGVEWPATIEVECAPNAILISVWRSQPSTLRRVSAR